MATKVAAMTSGAHPVLPDIGRPQMAKANVRTPDIAWNELIGRAIQAAVLECGWSNKEAAAKVGTDDAEFGKWLSGARRAQLDKLMAVPELRKPLAVQFWKLAGGRVRTLADFEDAA